MKLNKAVLFIGLCSWLMSCSESATDLEAELSELTDRWQGEYAPATGTPGPIQPYVMVRKVDLPAFGNNVIYFEIRNESRTGPAIRQRIFAFDDNPERAQNQVQSYDMLEDGWTPYVGTYDEPAKLTGLTPEQMYTFPKGCEIMWRREADDFIGEVTKDRCHINSRRNGELVHADMVFTVSETSFDQYEVIYDDQGGTVVGDPDAPPIVSTRVEEAQ